MGDIMNRKGFTLIELLVVIVMIGLLLFLIVPGFLKNVDTAKEKSYNSLIKNIITSSKLYYEECEYGDLMDANKYGDYACSISGATIDTTLGTLANTGFLDVNEIDKNTNKKIVRDPKTDKDISSCKIKITKVVEQTTYKVTYQIISNDINEICPTSYK